MDETQIIANGKQLGLKGDDLMNYVVAAKEEIVLRQREEAHLRAEEADRNARIKAEETIRNADIERDRLERQIRLESIQAQKEKDIRDHEAQREKDIREHELQILQLQQQQQIPDAARDPHVDNQARITEKGIKIPPFQERECITAYLDRFEKLMVMGGIPKEHWPVKIMASMTGKSLEIITQLSTDDLSNYDTIKSGILKGFGKTADHYRITFKTLRKEVNQTYAQYAEQMSRQLDLWINAKDIKENFKELKKLMLTDQLLTMAHPLLRKFLKEQNASSLQDIITHAECWLEANRRLLENKTNNGNNEQRFQQRDPNYQPRFNSQSQQQTRPQFNQNANNGSWRQSAPSQQQNSPRPYFNGQGTSEMRCYKCGGYGHTAKYCKQNPLVNASTNVSNEPSASELKVNKSDQNRINFALENSNVDNRL